MRLSLLAALVAVTSGVRITADPADSEAPKKSPFDKSPEEEKIEKFAFAKEQDAIKVDQKVHPDQMASTSVAPDRATIINQRKFWSDHVDHWEKAKAAEAKAVASLNPKDAKADAAAKK